MESTTRKATHRPAGKPARLTGGAPPGERHGNAKMTEAKVRDLRLWYATGDISILALAAVYDISYSTCREIINRRTWKHVPDLPVKDCGYCCGSGKVPA